MPQIQVPFSTQTVTMATTTTKTSFLVKPSRVSSARFAMTVLLGVNSMIKYLLMLAITSFNRGVFLAIILGLSVDTICLDLQMRRLWFSLTTPVPVLNF
ncbi:hypothetical protein LWI28_017829 [Acer negundo]|uniref:Copper transport protein n=1 Tax=Acer negundo TaxID=4023 RepID=A0AAD5P2F0_ACENE|nr:hypothetical protein LWI28_017829 [Acer negundo]